MNSISGKSIDSALSSGNFQIGVRCKEKGVPLSAETFAQFVEWVAEINPGSTDMPFRGQAKVSWELTPLIVRCGNTNRMHTGDLKAAERDCLEEFRRESIAYAADHCSNDWQLLALAQHHGLPTRMMDWTYNPLVALFFALSDQGGCEEDSAVYAIDNLAFAPSYLGFEQKDPFDIESTVQYTPPRFDQRMVAQESVLIVCHEPQEGIRKDEKRLKTVVIPADSKPELRQQLRQFGMSQKSLFPGLDGIARAIRDRIFLTEAQGICRRSVRNAG